jgi:hypothetical protein
MLVTPGTEMEFQQMELQQMELQQIKCECGE